MEDQRTGSRSRDRDGDIRRCRVAADGPRIDTKPVSTPHAAHHPPGLLDRGSGTLGCGTPRISLPVAGNDSRWNVRKTGVVEPFGRRSYREYGRLRTASPTLQVHRL